MSIKRIAVLTATRAEYSLLKPVYTALNNEKGLSTELLITGAHLSREFGHTIDEIIRDNVNPKVRIPIVLSDDTPSGVSKSMGLAIIGFADYFAESNPDMLIVLGDRYETLAVCCAALNARIPIAHIHGGETTEGAIDEAYRHAITKMSTLHFTSTEPYRKRVIQLGESPDKVFTVGALGVENALNVRKLSRETLQKELSINLSRTYAVVTFHPVTQEENTAETQCKHLLAALDEHNEMGFIITRANADAGGRSINALLDEYASTRDNVVLVSSLGEIRYLSALTYASMVIGNSSSGIIEAPSFQIPTVNIGDRQKGRIKSNSVIDCQPTKESISAAIHEALQARSHSYENPYFRPHTTKRIVEKVLDALKNGTEQLKKKFYDIEFEV